MSEQDTSTTTPEAAATATDDTATPAPQDAAETSSDDQDGKGPKGGSDALKADLARERRERQKLQNELKKLQDRDLSELERAQRTAKDATDRAEKAERAALRQQAAIKHQLTPDLAKRLQGDTEDELDADAAELAKLLTPKGPKPDLTQGSRADRSGPVDMNQMIRSAARRG